VQADQERPRPAALEARGLTKIYAGGTRALDGLDLVVPQGSFFGLLGPNGAGKTTLIGGAAGLVRVPSGQLAVFGHDAVEQAAMARLHLGLAPQEVHLDRFLTSLEGLIYHGRYFGMTTGEARERACELLAAFDLEDKADVRPNRLSGGMRRRLLIARAMMHRPPLLVLDEPTAGVDLELRHELWRYLRRLHSAHGATILLTTHYIEEAEALCEQIAFIRAGRIVAQGSPADLRGRFAAERLEQVYLDLMGDEGRPSDGSDPDAEAADGEASPTARSDSLADLPASGRRPALPLTDGRGQLPAPPVVQRRGMAALSGRETRRVLRLWAQTIVPPVLNGVIFLLVFGGALGARLLEVDGVPYLSFILPGLLVLTVSGQAFGNNATSIFQAKYEGHIEDILSSPLAAWRMALGYMAGGVVRAVLAAGALFLVAAPFTQGVSNPFLAVVALGLTGLLFSALGVVTGIWAETFDQFSFVANLIIAPLTLIAGVFYSPHQLPPAFAFVTRIDPIYYLVAATRTGFLGSHEASTAVSLLVAGGVAAGLFVLAAGMLARGWRLKP